MLTQNESSWCILLVKDVMQKLLSIRLDLHEHNFCSLKNILSSMNMNLLNLEIR